MKTEIEIGNYFFDVSPKHAIGILDNKCRLRRVKGPEQ